MLNKSDSPIAVVETKPARAPQLPPAPQSLSGTRQISVSFEYCLEFTEGVFEPDNLTLMEAIRRREPDRRHRAVCYIDAGFLRLNPGIPAALKAYVDCHSAHLELLSLPMTVDSGEYGKTQEAVHNIQRHMLSSGIDRQSVVIAIGGGHIPQGHPPGAASHHGSRSK